VATISELEFERLVDGIVEDREVIIRHNPIGSGDETLLWMLMSCLISYLSLDATDIPCFTGRPDAETYGEAIRFILKGRVAGDFDAEPYLAKLTAE
jgi:hypothetical protein